MKDAPSNQPEKKIEKGGAATKARAALAAIYLLAAGLPGIALPSKAKAGDDFGSYDYSYSTKAGEYTSDTYENHPMQKLDPKAEAERKQRQEVLRKELGNRPTELRKKMEELTSLGPTCREKVDRSMLQTTPGAKEMYDKLIGLFAEYNGYMGSLDDNFRHTPNLVNPDPPKPDADGYSYDYGYYDSYDFTDIEQDPSAALRMYEEWQSKIENGIQEIMQYPNAPELMKLLLEDANCAVS